MFPPLKWKGCKVQLFINENLKNIELLKINCWLIGGDATNYRWKIFGDVLKTWSCTRQYMVKLRFFQLHWRCWACFSMTSSGDFPKKIAGPSQCMQCVQRHLRLATTGRGFATTTWDVALPKPVFVSPFPELLWEFAWSSWHKIPQAILDRNSFPSKFGGNSPRFHHLVNSSLRFV